MPDRWAIPRVGRGRDRRAHARSAWTPHRRTEPDEPGDRARDARLGLVAPQEPRRTDRGTEGAHRPSKARIFPGRSGAGNAWALHHRTALRKVPDRRAAGHETREPVAALPAAAVARGPLTPERHCGERCCKAGGVRRARATACLPLSRTARAVQFLLTEGRSTCRRT